MESWVQSFLTAPVATVLALLCGVIGVMARHIVKQQDARIEDHRACLKESRELIVATNAALSSTSQAMTAAGAGLNSAREAMQVATAVMERASR